LPRRHRRPTRGEPVRGAKPPSRSEAERSDPVDEFAHIPRSRARHPIIAGAGALLAFFLVFASRGDLKYALSSRQSLDLGDARVTFAPGREVAGVENRYVRVAGLPDRESGLELDTKGSWVFSQLFRLLGTGDRMFVHRPENPLPAARAEADVFEGRLTRVDDLPYAAAIRAYFAKYVTATHFFTPEALARALAGRQQGAPLSVVDRAGDSVTLAPTEALSVEVVRPGEVQVGLPRARFATEADARAAVESRGGEIVASRGLVKAVPLAGTPEAGLLSSAPPPPERWTFVARFPAARRAAALGELGDIDRTVEIRDARETISTNANELSLAAGQPGLTIRPAAGGGERTVVAADIAAIRTMAPVVIPADAYLLTEGDHPGDHMATIFIALVLMTFGAFNIVGLIRSRLA
jgi:hypothetical protein